MEWLVDYLSSVVREPDTFFRSRSVNLHRYLTIRCISSQLNDNFTIGLVPNQHVIFTLICFNAFHRIKTLLFTLKSFIKIILVVYFRYYISSIISPLSLDRSLEKLCLFKVIMVYHSSIII